jgi:biopolymer transport protein ExbD
MAGRFKKKKENNNLNITSMMDMFTIILVFMLKNFAAEGNILTNADNLVLPYSISKDSPKEVTLSINATSDWVVIDNDPVIPTPEVRASEEVEIPRIRQQLEKKMEQEENMRRIGALFRIRGEVVIQVDKNMEFDIIYKIMTSCGLARYNNIHLAVMSQDE